MPDEPQQTPEITAPAEASGDRTVVVKSVTRGTSALPLWLAALIGGLFLALFILRDGGSAAPSPQIAVLNMQRLIEARSMSIKSIDPKTVSSNATEFAGALKQIVNRYTAKGYYVINTAHLIAWPASADITAQIAKNLRIDLKLADVAERQRERRTDALLEKAQAAESSSRAPVDAN